MKFAVIVFPGSNCDYDAYYVIKHQLELEVDFVWHQNSDLSEYDCIIIPGGFSYGDYLRAGAIARFSKIMESIKSEANKGKAIIGICNGFQILVESGLLPGALITNQSTRFISRTITLKVFNNTSLFTSHYTDNEIIYMPIAHKQGNYIATKDTIKKLESEDRILFKYHIDNPNGSVYNIGGIINKERNVLGMMPHPERACEQILGSDDGKKIFESIIGKC